MSPINAADIGELLMLQWRAGLAAANVRLLTADDAVSRKAVGNKGNMAVL
jgi:hypothetical protein